MSRDILITHIYNVLYHVMPGLPRYPELYHAETGTKRRKHVVDNTPSSSLLCHISNRISPSTHQHHSKMNAAARIGRFGLEVVVITVMVRGLDWFIPSTEKRHIEKLQVSWSTSLHQITC